MANWQPCVEVKWNGIEHSQNLATAMYDSMNKGFLVDVTLISSGQELKAHKIVLSSASEYFQNLFAGSPYLTSTTLDVPFTVMEALVQYCYLGELKIPALEVTSCVQAGKRLGIKGFGGFYNPDKSQPSRLRTSKSIRHPSSQVDVNSNRRSCTKNTNPRKQVASIPPSIRKVVLPTGISVDNIYDPIIKLNRIDQVPGVKGPISECGQNSSPLPEIPATPESKRHRAATEKDKTAKVKRKTRAESVQCLTRASSPVSVVVHCNVGREVLVQEAPETDHEISQCIGHGVQKVKRRTDDIPSDPDSENFLGWSGSESLDDARCFLRPFSKLTCRACDHPFGYMQTFIEHLSWCSNRCANLLCPRCDRNFPRQWGVTPFINHLSRCHSRNAVTSVSEQASNLSNGL